MFATLVRHGHRLEDVKFKYTIDQVGLFYRYSIEDDFLNYRIGALSMAKAGALYAQYAKEVDSRRAFQQFKEFIESLDPGKVREREKESRKQVQDPFKVFQGFKGLGIAGI